MVKKEKRKEGVRSKQEKLPRMSQKLCLFKTFFDTRLDKEEGEKTKTEINWGET